MRPTLAITLASIICLAGCSQTETPEAAATSAKPAALQPDSNHPATISASQFLNALAKGDERTATGRLTPLAAEQMAKSGKRFAFSAVDAASFHLTKYWQPQPDEAAIEFHMTAEADGESVEFDLCCFMREVDGDWRLGGIAYDLGDGQQPVVVNYEAIETPSGGSSADAVQTVASPAEKASPPQISQSPQGTQIR